MSAEERIAAALAIHKPYAVMSTNRDLPLRCSECVEEEDWSADWPCSTARALGVTDASGVDLDALYAEAAQHERALEEDRERIRKFHEGHGHAASGECIYYMEIPEKDRARMFEYWLDASSGWQS